MYRRFACWSVVGRCLVSAETVFHRRFKVFCRDMTGLVLRSSCTGYLMSRSGRAGYPVQHGVAFPLFKIGRDVANFVRNKMFLQASTPALILPCYVWQPYLLRWLGGIRPRMTVHDDP